MRLLVSGKGGAGKSAVAILLAKALSKKGNVVLMDSDESNRLLAHNLGVESPDTIANYLGGRTTLRDQIKESDLRSEFYCTTIRKTTVNICMTRHQKHVPIEE